MRGNHKYKYMKVTLCALLAVLIVPYSVTTTPCGRIQIGDGRAEAAFSFIRAVDGWKESAILSSMLETLNFTRDVLTNLQNIRAIAELKNMMKEFNDIKEQTKSVQNTLSFKDAFIKETLGTADKIKNSVNLGNELKSGLMKDIDNVMSIKDSVNPASLPDIGKLLDSGDYETGASIGVERAREALEKTLGLPSKTRNTVSTRKNDWSDGGNSQKKHAADAGKSALEIAKEVVPVSFGGMQRALAEIAAESKLTAPQKKLFAAEVADNTRNKTIEQIARIITPYVVPANSELSYRKHIDKIREQSEKSLEKAGELSGGGPSQALRTIAGLSAVLIEQTALQNELLASLNDTIADEIKINGVIALLSVEGYTEGVRSGTERYIELGRQLAK